MSHNLNIELSTKTDLLNTSWNNIYVCGVTDNTMFDLLLTSVRALIQGDVTAKF